MTKQLNWAEHLSGEWASGLAATAPRASVTLQAECRPGEFNSQHCGPNSTADQSCHGEICLALWDLVFSFETSGGGWMLDGRSNWGGTGWAFSKGLEHRVQSRQGSCGSGEAPTSYMSPLLSNSPQHTAQFHWQITLPKPVQVQQHCQWWWQSWLLGVHQARPPTQMRLLEDQEGGDLPTPPSWHFYPCTYLLIGEG